MPENNQASGKTKPEATGSSSTQPGSQAIDMNHTNAIVPHQISNHDKLVQTMVMVDGEWINVNDTNDQANMKDDMNKVNKKVVEAQKGIVEAKSAADSAAKAADSAVSASVVNSDAITAQSAAISEAKSAISSATAAIQQTAATAASDAAKIRADVAQVQNEVNTAKAANSASVEALKSDVSAAKQDLADVHDRLDQAQSAIEQNQKLINDSVAKITSDVSSTKQDLANVHDSLAKAQAAAEANQKAINQSIAQINSDVDGTKQDLAGVRKNLTKAQADITANQKSINDNVAQINADITQDRKDIASAQQANADTAKQLDTYSKQAQEQGRTIKAVQDKQDGFSITLADVQGNVSQVSDKIDGLSASLKDTQGNVASVKAQADQLNATLTDHAKSIATLTASAKELSSTLEDADGRLNKVEQTAQTNSSTLSDVQGNLSQVKQQADGLVSTLKDAQGNISTLQQKADSLSTQLASGQGDIATLQTGIDGVKAILTSHDKSIHTLQADSKSLKDSMTNAQGDISTLRKTATDVTSELEDHTGRLSKVEQSAAKQATTLSDLQGNLSQVEQKADSNTATISSINKNAMQDRGVITDTKTSFDSLTQLGTYSIKASGLPMMPEQHYGTLVVSGSAGSGWLSQQFVADTTENVYTRVFSNNAWSAWKQGGSQDAINQVKQTADSNSATIRNVQGDVSTLKQTATGVEATLADHEGDIHTLQADNKSLKDSMADAQGDISTLSKTATSLDSEMKDHAGRLSKVEQSATTQATTLSDLQGNLSQVKQQADGLVTTLKDAQGSITQIQQKADGTLAQLKSAQGDIASLQTDVTGIKATLTDHEGDIHTLQADSKTLKDDMQDAQGDISTLKKTSTDVTAELQDHAGRISKTEQTASTLVNELADQQGHLNRVEQTAQGTQQTVANQQGQINNIKTDAASIHETLTGQGNQIANINVTLGGLSTKYEDVSGDLSKLKDSNQWKIVTGAFDANQYTQTARIFYQDTQAKNTPDSGWFYLMVEAPETNRITQNLIKDNSNDSWSRFYNGEWSSWTKGTTQLDIESLSNKITTNATSIEQNKQAIALKADQSTVNNLSGEVNQNKAQLKVQAGQISSKVSSEDFSALNDRAMQNRGTVSAPDFNSLMQAGYYTVTMPHSGKNYPTVSWGTLEVSGQASDANGRLNQKYVSDNNVETYVRQYNANTKSWTAWIKAANQNDINTLDGKISKNSTAIDQTNKQISLKADQTEVDTIKGTASQNSSRLDVMAGQISSKVTSTDVNNIVDKKGYATTSTVQSLITQKAGTINESITSLDLKYNATVTQVQSLTASIDGLQSTVANKADKSQITQLSNVIQSKVSSTDFNNLRKAVDLQTLESADANNLKTNGHYFVHNLANNPIPGWVYVDVTGNNNDRIRQDVYQDNGNKHKYRRWVGNSWTDWSQSATESEITQLRDDINLRVKSGDLLSQINIQAGHTLIQSNKIYFDADSFVMSPNSKAFIPAALITNLTADQITTGTLKSIQIDNGDGKFTVNSNGDVVANSIKLRNGQFLQGTIAGSTIYALNNDGAQDPKLAPKSDWYKITPNMIRWFNHYDQSVGQIGVGQGVITEGNSEFTGTPGLTISDSARILLGTAQRTVVTGDEIGNLETTGLDWMSRTNLEIKADGLQVNLDPGQGNGGNGKGAEFVVQKDNKIGAYFGSGDHGDGLSITTTGGITFNAGFFDVWGEVHIPNNGLTVKDLHVTHWLGVDGSKNSIVNTSQGTVAINAYETAEYYFGDIGEDQTNGDGKVWVSIDYLFGQTVNTSVPYQVFVTPYSSAHVWVSKRLKNRFLVESDKPSASFAWEIKAKRKGYEHTRLKNVDNMMEKPAGVK